MADAHVRLSIQAIFVRIREFNGFFRVFITHARRFKLHDNDRDA